jgi:hypothetical protein
MTADIFRWENLRLTANIKRNYGYQLWHDFSGTQY